MPRRALIESRPWLLGSLVSGITYWLFRGAPVPGVLVIAWKGAGVACLAGYALSRLAGRDRVLLGTAMALGALGDVLIEIDLTMGALAFFFAHIAAIALYARHRRSAPTPSQRLFGASLLLLTPLIAFSLPADRGQALPVAFYAAALGGMACAAWLSRFNRYRVGFGAVLFVVSDLLIFARMGPLATSAVPDLLIWPFYYFGQLLICTGVVAELRPEAD